jgi:transposase
MLASRPHPQQGFRSCLGIMRLGKRYGDARLEAACQRALTLGARRWPFWEAAARHRCRGCQDVQHGVLSRLRAC